MRRRQYATVDDLVALFIARDIPATSVKWLTKQVHTAASVTEYLNFKGSEGQPRRVNLSFRFEPGGWKVVVPLAAMERMAEELAGTLSLPNPI